MRPLRVDADNSPRERKTQWKTKEERKTLLFMEIEQRERFFLNFNFSTCAFVSNFVVAIFFPLFCLHTLIINVEAAFPRKNASNWRREFFYSELLLTPVLHFLWRVHTQILLMQGGVVIWCNYCFGRVADCARHTN